MESKVDMVGNLESVAVEFDNALITPEERVTAVALSNDYQMLRDE